MSETKPDFSPAEWRAKRKLSKSSHYKLRKLGLAPAEVRPPMARSLCSQSARLAYLGNPRLSSSEFDPTETSSPQPPWCSFLNQRLLPPRGC
jgi:hypothetical protein